MTEGPELDLGLPPPARKPSMADLLGRHVTISNPGNDSSWTGRVIAYHDDPGVVIETADGTHMCLPQAFMITEAEEPAAEPEIQLPDGEYARVEILGHDSHTGWVTEATRAGQPVMVVRDWDGHVLAEVPGHSLYRFVPLATPMKRPERPALPSGRSIMTDEEYAELQYENDAAADINDRDYDEEAPF